MKKTALLIASVVILFSGCVSTSDTKESDVTAEIFSRGNSSIEYEADTDFQPISPGQWLILRKQEGREQVYLKYAAYLDAAGSKWIEVNDFRKNKKIIVQFQVSTYEAASVDGLGIVKGHYFQNDRQMDHAAMMMGMYLQPVILLKNAVKLNVSVPTPAGLFKNVYGYSGSSYREFSFENDSVSISLKDTQSGTMFYHPALPFNGLVGWNSTNDQAEVVEFGFTGAVPAKALG